MLNANNNIMQSAGYELLVEPIDNAFSKLLVEGRLKPKRGFNLHHEASYAGLGNYFICFLLEVFASENLNIVSAFVLGVIDSEEIKLKVKPNDILELWEGINFIGSVKIKEVKYV
ncbi:MAG: hypothetical protein J0L55_13650 [Caulobacterales bacterium]|nr:hypothetical protein [Caulobacterales bacterium]MCA0373397.1 hypothetical protein [Pseudomonadota bacterium]